MMRTTLKLKTVVVLAAVAGCGGEERAWEGTVEIGSQRAYESFIVKYPDSDHVEEALLRIPQHIFQNAEASRSMALYQQLLSEFPESELATRASERMADIERWEQAQEEIAITLYESYLAQYPSGLFADDAERRIRLIESYLLAREEDVVSAYDRFSAEHPQSILADEVSIRVSEIAEAARAYEALESETTPGRLGEFVESYGQTGYGRLARSRLNELFFVPRSELEPAWSEWEGYGLEGEAGMFCSRQDGNNRTTVGMIRGTMNTIAFDRNARQVPPTRPGSKVLFETTGCVLGWTNSIQIEAEERLTFLVTDGGLMYESGRGRLVFRNGRVMEFR